MSVVVIAPILVALVTAVLTLLARPSGRLQQAISLLGGVAYFGVVALMFQRVVFGGGGRTLIYQVSNWRAPYGIVLVADALSAFMLGLAAIVSLAGVVFSVLHIDTYGQRLTYHPLYHFMMAGVSGAFLTGDLFNLFVWFEVMLMSSYVLVVFYSGPEHTRAALNYVVLNLIGSAVMLVAIGGLYATTGTLNMADMARRLANPEAWGVAVVPTLGLSAVLFAVFALKAGLVPFQFWVPAAYRAAPNPVTAVLAGVVKKVGVYATIRLYFTVFARATFPDGLGLPGLRGESALAFFGPVLFVMAAASVVFGGFGATGRDDIDGVLAYSSIGQVGFIVLPLGVAATAGVAGATAGVGADAATLRRIGVAAALVYALNHGLAKGLLFLTSATVKDAVGTTQFERLGGLAPRAPFLAASFLIGALALVGIPPLTGFFAKLLVFQTGTRALATGAVGAWATLGVALLGAVFTVAYFSRAWNLIFWGEAADAVDAALPARWVRADTGGDAAVADGSGETETGSGTEGPSRVAEAPSEESDSVTGSLRLTGELVVVVSLALTIVALGIGFEFVSDAARTAARAALDWRTYVDAVGPAAPGGATGGGGETGGGGTHAVTAVALGAVARARTAGGRVRVHDRDHGRDADREVDRR